ncbi:MAG: FHA domain-containing protein [Actinomycetota bacterium]|nr:FHA domain-containing protein [Actinomycetota bacterium]MDH5225109.1 FHA domain-containing protein [Actinomycetota bacterium]MDH5314004.1 FHA domain-containing protein [Actinomycetota bacterium]
MADMLAQSVTPFALSALKYGLFALLLLFIWRSMRWVVRGLTVETAPRTRRGSKNAGAAEPTVPPGPSMVVVHEEGSKPRSVPVSGNMVLGRAAECELALDDTYISQQHARLFAKDGSWYVEDLGSTNGTFVNDQRLASPAMVQPGDRVRVGTTVLELRR